jgi:predicted ATPase
MDDHVDGGPRRPRPSCDLEGVVAVEGAITDCAEGAGCRGLGGGGQCWRQMRCWDVAASRLCGMALCGEMLIATEAWSLIQLNGSDRRCCLRGSMFRQLTVQNFKAWSLANLELGRITGLFGTNSSGKTSLIQFLLLLKQTKDAADRGLTLELGGPYITLGSYHDFIHNHELSNSLAWSLSWDQDDDLALIDPAGKRNEVFARGKNITVDVSIEAMRGAPRARSLTYRFQDHAFSLVPRSGDATAFDLQAEGDFKFVRTMGRPWQLPGPVKAYGFPDQAQTYFQNSGFLASFVAAFEAQMDRVFYLGPLREYPKREYVWTRSRPSDVGPRGERAIEAILAATERDEKRNLAPKTKLRPFQEMIAYWLREMGLVESFEVEEIKAGSGLYQAKVRVRKGASEVLLTEVGFGVSQVLPVLTLLYYVDEGSTVILEQPEIHLHPLAQAGLADAIISVSMRRRIQIIVESHSENFLLRLQRRIAERVIDPGDVKLYFCQAEEGAPQLTPLRIDILGNIENWPKNFFGDAFGEVASAEVARLKRQASSR